MVDSKYNLSVVFFCDMHSYTNTYLYLISGSTCGKISVDKCLDNIAESINQAHSKTNNVITGKIYKAKMVSGSTLNPRRISSIFAQIMKSLVSYLHHVTSILYQ